jgi:hypothetical protein
MKRKRYILFELIACTTAILLPQGLRAQQLPVSGSDTLEVRLAYRKACFSLESDALDNPAQLVRDHY